MILCTVPHHRLDRTTNTVSRHKVQLLKPRRPHAALHISVGQRQFRVRRHREYTRLPRKRKQPTGVALGVHRRRLPDQPEFGQIRPRRRLRPLVPHHRQLHRHQHTHKHHDDTHLHTGKPARSSVLPQHHGPLSPVRTPRPGIGHTRSDAETAFGFQRTSQKMAPTLAIMPTRPCSSVG